MNIRSQRGILLNGDSKYVNLGIVNSVEGEDRHDI